MVSCYYEKYPISTKNLRFLLYFIVMLKKSCIFAVAMLRPNFHGDMRTEEEGTGKNKFLRF